MRKIIAFAPLWALFSLFAFNAWAKHCNPGYSLLCTQNGGTCNCALCQFGRYCPGGDLPENHSAGNYPCPEDRPFSYTGASNINQCLSVFGCVSGKFLPKNSRTCSSCPSGYYCPGGTFGFDQYHDQGLVECPSATPFSPSSSSNESACQATITCSAGHYLPAGTRDCSSMCRLGYYCPGGTFSFDANNDQVIVQCPSVAPYTSSPTATQESDCRTLTVTCAAGKYLPAGVFYADACKNCPSGYYCEGDTFDFNPTQDQGLKLCPSATPYSPPSSASDAACTVAPSVNVPAGKYLKKGDTTTYDCPEGYYCEGGTLFVSTTDDVGLTACPVATPYSPAQSSSASACVAIQCTAGTYVPAGEITYASCPVGSYCAGGTFGYNASADQGITACNSATPYSVPGSSSSSDCYTIICSLGYYLPAASSTCQQCPANSYCSGGAFDLNNNDNQGITACSGTTPVSQAGSDDAGDCHTAICSAGQYLPADALSCTQCREGYYCLGGEFNLSSSDQGLTQCDSATPFSRSGASSPSECVERITCSTGQYLPAAGLECVTCPANSYCVGGTELDYDATNAQGITACSGTTPVSQAGSDDAGDCYTATCSAGQYLPAAGLACVTCPANHYCLGGTEFDYDENNDQGLTACPQNMPNSAAGATSAGACYASVTCAAGTYLPMGQLTCAPCTAGNYCLGGTLNSSTVADQGLTACDNATPFSPAGASSSSQCSATIDCAPGYYLPSKAKACVLCTANAFCTGLAGASYSSGTQGFAWCRRDAGRDYQYSDAGAPDISFCYSDSTTEPCSKICSVPGATVTWASPATATVRIYYINDGQEGTDITQPTTIGACAIQSASCATGYTTNATYPLFNYVLQSRNLDFDESAVLGLANTAGDHFSGSTSGMTAGTFRLQYKDGTKIFGRASCNSTNASEFGVQPYATFTSSSSGVNCWCNMTGYQLNGQSAVTVNDSKWVYVHTYSGNKCSSACANYCSQLLLLSDEETYENALFGSYATPCTPNTYNITWKDGATTLSTNQCSYGTEFSVPEAPKVTGYTFLGYRIPAGN